MRKKYKTKFPVARIKKIMQMDEDVGKVAQATPVLISKALELFMQSLIDKACAETRSRNGKRLSVAHLKRTIETTDQFDFLKDVVADIPDPGEGPPPPPPTEEGSSSRPPRKKREQTIVFEDQRRKRGRGRGRGGRVVAPVSDVRGRGKRKVEVEAEEEEEEEEERPGDDEEEEEMDTE